MTIDDEVRRATKLLETIMQAGGLSRKDLDQRLGAGPGYVSQLFTGRMELKVRHVLAILRALRVEPGVFFQTLYPDGKPVGEKRLTEEFLKRFRGLGDGAAPTERQAAAFDVSALHDLIQSAVRAALREIPQGGPVGPDPSAHRPPRPRS